MGGEQDIRAPLQSKSSNNDAGLDFGQVLVEYFSHRAADDYVYSTGRRRFVYDAVVGLFGEALVLPGLHVENKDEFLFFQRAKTV